MYFFYFANAKALHFIPLGGPPGPRSRSKHSLAPIRLYLRFLEMALVIHLLVEDTCNESTTILLNDIEYHMFFDVVAF